MRFFIILFTLFLSCTSREEGREPEKNFPNKTPKEVVINISRNDYVIREECDPFFKLFQDEEPCKSDKEKGYRSEHCVELFGKALELCEDYINSNDSIKKKGVFK